MLASVTVPGGSLGRTRESESTTKTLSGSAGRRRSTPKAKHRRRLAMIGMILRKSTRLHKIAEPWAGRGERAGEKSPQRGRHPRPGVEAEGLLQGRRFLTGPMRGSPP